MAHKTSKFIRGVDGFMPASQNQRKCLRACCLGILAELERARKIMLNVVAGLEKHTYVSEIVALQWRHPNRIFGTAPIQLRKHPAAQILDRDIDTLFKLFERIRLTERNCARPGNLTVRTRRGGQTSNNVIGLATTRVTFAGLRVTIRIPT